MLLFSKQLKINKQFKPYYVLGSNRLIINKSEDLSNGIPSGSV